MRIYLAACAAVLLSLSACGTDEPDSATDPAAPAPTVTVTATPEPVTEPEPVVETTAEPEPVEEPTEPQADGVDTFVMPNEIGNDLQFAQDHLQSITDNFAFYSRSEDATGDGRSQMIDSGWTVCSQSPEAGATFDYNTDVVFFVVRESESCP